MSMRPTTATIMDKVLIHNSATMTAKVYTSATMTATQPISISATVQCILNPRAGPWLDYTY